VEKGKTDNTEINLSAGVIFPVKLLYFSTLFAWDLLVH
jgi:hypothetical protein